MKVRPTLFTDGSPLRWHTDAMVGSSLYVGNGVDPPDQKRPRSALHLLDDAPDEPDMRPRSEVAQYVGLTFGPL